MGILKILIVTYGFHPPGFNSQRGYFICINVFILIFRLEYTRLGSIVLPILDVCVFYPPIFSPKRGNVMCIFICIPIFRLEHTRLGSICFFCRGSIPDRVIFYDHFFYTYFQTGITD